MKKIKAALKLLESVLRSKPTMIMDIDTLHDARAELIELNEMLREMEGRGFCPPCRKSMGIFCPCCMEQLHVKSDLEKETAWLVGHKLDCKFAKMLEE